MSGNSDNLLQGLVEPRGDVGDKRPNRRIRAQPYGLNRDHQHHGEDERCALGARGGTDAIRRDPARYQEQRISHPYG